MTTLQDLLVQARDLRDGASGRAMADEAARHGHKIDRTQVNDILRGTYKSRPGRPLLEAVAWLAQADLAEAYEAADLPLPGPPFADELPPNTDYLLPHERKAVIEVVRAFLVSHALEDRSDLSRADRVSLSRHLVGEDDVGGDDVDGDSHSGVTVVQLAPAARNPKRPGRLHQDLDSDLDIP